MQKPSSDKLRLALTITQAVLLVLAAVAVCFAVSLGVSFLSIEDAPLDSTTSEEIGVGLSRAFTAVFFVIAAVVTLLLSIPGEIIAILMTVKTKGWGKTFGICGIVAYAVFMLSCGIFFLLVV